MARAWTRRWSLGTLVVLAIASACIASACGETLPESAVDQPPVRDGGVDDANGPGSGEAGADSSAEGCTASTDVQSNSDHCGKCNVSCRGAKCTLGVCEATVLAMPTTSPLGIAVDETHVYWTTNSTPGAVVRIAKNATAKSASEAFSSDTTAFPEGIATGGGFVYWVAGNDVFRRSANAPAAAPSEKHTPGGTATDLKRIQVNIDKILFTASTGTEAGLWTAPLDISESGPVGSVQNAVPFVEDGTDIWIANWGGGIIYHLPSSANQPNFNSVRAFALSDDDVWWTYLLGVAWMGRADFKASGTATPIPENTAVGGIVYDRKRGVPFYVTTNAVKRLDAKKTPVKVASTDCPSPGLVAQDDDALYWTCPPTNTVWRWTKPPL